VLKVGGTVEEYEAKADSVKASLRQELLCDLPACVLTVTVKAGSVILTVVATDTSGGASQIESAAVALQTKALDAMSIVLGVTIEEPPATPSVTDVEVQVMQLAPSPPRPSPLPTSPPPLSLPPPLPPPPSLPTPPPAPPTATSEDKANSQGPLSVPLWVLLLLLLVVLLLVVLIVLGYPRMSRDRANLRISRDRANIDLQMISHQVQVMVQKGPDTQTDDSASLPDSLPAKRSISLANTRTASLPPGPPSSSNGQPVAEQEKMPALWAVPATWAGWNHHWLANRFGAVANSGAAPMAPTSSAAAPTVGSFSSLRRANFSAPPKRPAQPESASTPRSKRAFTSDSPPTLLPFGAPSDSASGSYITPPPGLQRLAEGAGVQSSGAVLTAPASGLEEGSAEPTEAELAAFMADDEVVLEMQSLQDILGYSPALANPEMAADVKVALTASCTEVATTGFGRQRNVAHKVQRAVDSTPPTPPPEATPLDPGWLTEMLNELDEGNNDAGSERQEAHLPVGPPGSLDHGQGSMTPRQRALHVARQRMQFARTDAEIQQAVHTLATALGASRIEGATIKALHAVLLTLERPEMSDKQAYTSTGGSLSNFKKWRKKVQHAQLLPAP